MPETIKKVKNQIPKIITVFIMMILLLKSCEYYSQKNANDFCNSVNEHYSISTVYEKAETLGYRIFRDDDSGGVASIRVPTQDSPYFRFACVISFKNGKLVEKEVVADD